MLTENIEKRIYYTELTRLYGALLTERQREAMTLYFFEDLSLAEIGERAGISRQAAYDIIKRSINRLESWEGKLSFFKKLSEIKLKVLNHFSSSLTSKELEKIEEFFFV